MVLAELYITFEIIGFILLLKGIEERRIVYPLLAMSVFFALTVQGASIESIFTGTTVNSTQAIMFNLMFAVVSFLYSMFTILEHFKKSASGQKTVEEI